LSKLSDAADEADEQAKVRKKLVLLGIVVVLAVGIYFLFLRTPPEPSPESLLESALTVGDPKERLRAAIELSHRQTDLDRVRPLMRRLADESKDPELIAVALGLLARYADTESMPRFIEAMAHEDARVRAKGAEGMKALGGGSIGVGLGLQMNQALRFSATDPPETRQAVVRKLRELLKAKEEQDAALAKQAEAEKNK